MAEQQSESGNPNVSRMALSVPGQQVMVDSGSRSNWADLDGDLGRRRGTSTTNFSTLLHGLRRHWMLGLICGILVSAGAAAGAWLWFTPEFSAFAILRVAGQEPRLVFPTAENSQRSDFEIYKRTQKELMRSRFVLTAALRSPDIERLPAVRAEDDPVTWLEKHIYIDFPGEGEIMRITFGHENAETAAAIANAVTKAYMREVVDRERRLRMDRLTSLEKIFSDSEDKMRAKQADLKRLADSLGTGDGNALSAKQQITLQHFAVLRNEHTRLHFELMRTTHSLAALEAESKSNPEVEPEGPDDEMVEDYVAKVPELNALKGKIEQMRHLVEENEKVMANSNHPRLEKQREDLNKAEAELAEKHDTIKGKIRKELVKMGVKGPAGTVGLKHQMSVLKAQEKQMSAEVEKFAKEAESIGRSSIDVEMMRSDLKQIEKLSAELGKEIESLRVELRSPSRVIELQPADVPRSRDTVGRIRTTSIVGILGFLLPFLAVSLWDARAQRVNHAGEIAEGLGMRIVGALPALPAHAHKLSRTGQPLVPRLQYMLRESFDTLRTTLIRGVDGQSHRLVLVTSALSGEGKTTLATQLAFSFARSGRRTLLVDCDLRRPAVHRIFGLPREGGLGEVLRSEVALTDAIRATLTPNLWVLSAGRCDQQALSALAQRQMFLGECFQKMREDFEFVIIDCSPVLPVVDSMLIGQHVDIAVLSVLRDVSQVPRVDEANRRLTSMGIRVFGAVVTGAVGGNYYHQEYHEELSV